METPVTFPNKLGQTLFGILHMPEAPPPGERRLAVNLLNPGIKYRVAPNRLNVSLARELCSIGIPVLRFDPAGIGDSQGDLPHGVLVPDIWESIQKGAFVSDTICANDFLVRRLGLDRLVLIGNCGGAITALLASTQDHRIQALCLIDVPVNLRTADMSLADKILEGGESADRLYKQYVKKAFHLSSWIRFLTLKTDYRSLFKLLRMKLPHPHLRNKPEAPLPQVIERLCRQGRLNRLFFESLAAFSASHRPALFLLAGNDPGTEFFLKYVASTHFLDRTASLPGRTETQVVVIEKANHAYTQSDSKIALKARILEFVSSMQTRALP